jgi:hypothetical protein
MDAVRGVTGLSALLTNSHLQPAIFAGRTCWISPLETTMATKKLNRFQKAALSRKTFGGPAKVLRKCPDCKGLFGGREMRAHLPQCPGPAPRKKAA